MKKLENLEGLRAYMSIWVFITHAIPLCLFSLDNKSYLGRILLDGQFPVGVFIILSGFVIGILLNKNEGYIDFIKRRFFRLFPVYIFVLILTALFSNLIIEYQLDYPWLNSKVESEFNFKIHSGIYFYIDFISHLFLLHGLIPENIFLTSCTLVGQAWSLTLEWQFYLIAPFLFYVYKSENSKLKILTFTLVIIVVGLSRILLPQRTFLPNYFLYFVVGFISFELYSKNHLNYLFVFLMCIILFFMNTNPIASTVLLIWSSTVYLQSKLSKVNFIFRNKFILYLGKISYSIYCNHMLVLFFTSWLALNYLSFASKLSFGLFIFFTSFLLTILLSSLTYHFIEERFIEYGKKHVKRNE